MCVYVYLYVIQYCRTHSKHPRLIWQESRAHPHHEVKRPGKIVMFTIVDLFTVLKNVPAASSAVLWTKKQGSCTVKSRHLCLPSFQPAKQEKVICIVVFCSVLSLIHEIINDINGNKSEKLRSHLPPMWHQWKPAERVLPVASSTGMPELATGSKPVQSGPSRSNSAKYGKNMAKMASTILHNITI